MLETIFFPNNAIHDGGVIIKGDRIAYAACIFPLTQRQDLNKSLGTRHRAAIGLSEETDAVIVVVSEETGMISHAYKGQLVRGVTLEELRAFLTSVLLKPERITERRRWLRAHFGEHHKPGPAVVTKERAGPRRGKPRRQMKFLSHARLAGRGFRLEIVFARPGRRHLADRHKILPGIGAPAVKPRWQHADTSGNLPVLIVATAADVHDFRVSPKRSRSPSAARPEPCGTCRPTRSARMVDLTGIESARDLRKRSVDVSVPAGVTVVDVAPDRGGSVCHPRRRRKILI